MAGDDVVKLAMQLINVESITYNEYPMIGALKSWLQPRGWTIELQLVEKKRYNVLAYPDNTNPKEAKLLFNSHIDTVPPYFGPALIKNNKIYGRGACDTKSLIAAQLIVANKIYHQYGIKSIALLYTVGEEIDSIGMIAANKLNLNPKYMITGEPTESRTVIAQKGEYIFELKSRGKAAHSAYPENGQCALTPLLNVLHDINNHKWPCNDIFGETTVNIWIKKGGVAANVIPEYCAANILFRCSVKTNILKKIVRDIIDKYDKENQIEHVMIAECPPVRFETINEKYNPFLVSYGTDIPYFKNVVDGKCKAILFGPGSITVAHSDHEHIDIDELRKGMETYEEIAIYALKKCGVNISGVKSKL